MIAGGASVYPHKDMSRGKSTKIDLMDFKITLCLKFVVKIEIVVNIIFKEMVL